MKNSNVDALSRSPHQIMGMLKVKPRLLSLLSEDVSDPEVTEDMPWSSARTPSLRYCWIAGCLSANEGTMLIPAEQQKVISCPTTLAGEIPRGESGSYGGDGERIYNSLVRR